MANEVIGGGIDKALAGPLNLPAKLEGPHGGSLRGRIPRGVPELGAGGEGMGTYQMPKVVDVSPLSVKDVVARPPSGMAESTTVWSRGVPDIRDKVGSPGIDFSGIVASLVSMGGKKPEDPVRLEQSGSGDNPVIVYPTRAEINAAIATGDPKELEKVRWMKIYWVGLGEEPEPPKQQSKTTAQKATTTQAPRTENRYGYKIVDQEDGAEQGSSTGQVDPDELLAKKLVEISKGRPDGQRAIEGPHLVNVQGFIFDVQPRSVVDTPIDPKIDKPPLDS